jgi:hypothetical protein
MTTSANIAIPTIDATTAAFQCSIAFSRGTLLVAGYPLAAPPNRETTVHPGDAVVCPTVGKPETTSGKQDGV